VRFRINEEYFWALEEETTMEKYSKDSNNKQKTVVIVGLTDPECKGRIAIGSWAPFHGKGSPWSPFDSMIRYWAEWQTR